eukprot:4294866-Pyramimonas_sp.AAC.1
MHGAATLPGAPTGGGGRLAKWARRLRSQAAPARWARQLSGACGGAAGESGAMGHPGPERDLEGQIGL